MVPTLYATLDADSCGHTNARHIPTDLPILLPASSWARKGLAPVVLPGHQGRRAADGGGFVAMRKWGGVYPYTPLQYLAWLFSFAPDWAAMFDYCCEPAIAADAAAVRDRQERTTDMAALFWREHRDVPWAWVPTVQGWHPADYVRHARALRPLVLAMRAHYAATGRADAFRVGIGTLCQRKDMHEARAIVRAVARELPGVRLHLWGVKLDLVSSHEALPAAVASMDTAAWNGRFGTDLERHRREQRARGMTQREYGYRVLLPAYAAKFGAVVRRPKQLPLALEMVA